LEYIAVIITQNGIIAPSLIGFIIWSKTKLPYSVNSLGLVTKNLTVGMKAVKRTCVYDLLMVFPRLSLPYQKTAILVSIILKINPGPAEGKPTVYWTN